MATLDGIISIVQYDTKDRVEAKQKAVADIRAYIAEIIGDYDDLPTKRPENMPDEKWAAVLERIAVRNSLRLEQRKRAGL